MARSREERGERVRVQEWGQELKGPADVDKIGPGTGEGRGWCNWDWGGQWRRGKKGVRC